MRISNILIILMLHFIPILSCASEKNEILIISSYAPDSKRITDFISELKQAQINTNTSYKFTLQDMGCGSISSCNLWKSSIEKILKHHKEEELKAIILLGQEAWSTFNSLKRRPNVPFYGCFASVYGIKIPNEIINSTNWEPKSIHLLQEAQSNGQMGGIFVKYDIESNIKLVKLLYPSVNKIAFLTDATYGGLSLKRRFENIMIEKHPNIQYDLLDGRKYSADEIADKISKYDNKTAILIATWRIDKSDTFVLQGSLNDLFSKIKKTIPTFSVTGLGVGTVAIGGYYPDYRNDVNTILSDIFAQNNNSNFRIKQTITIDKLHYYFDTKMMEEYGIKDFQLPKNINYIDNTQQKLSEYQRSLNYISTLSIILSVALLLSIGLYMKNRKINKRLTLQKDILNKQQDELVKARNEAVKSDKLKSAFLANMSHEIRTPLNAIIGFSEILKNSDIPEEKEMYWNIIRTNNELLLNLINDVLELSKIESGVNKTQLSEFDLAKTFDSIYYSSNQRCKNPEVDFICDNPYYNCLVTLDEHKIIQIITNFINNAIKFTKKGHIKIGYNIENNSIRIYCEDTGIGIAPDKLNRIFDRFYKVDDFSQGTGLGMAICKAIVEELNGRIGVESKEGVGSTFWAYLESNSIISPILKNRRI